MKMTSSKTNSTRGSFRCLQVALVLVVMLLAGALPVTEAKFCFKCLFHCPKDDSYDPACLRSALPPWPICLFHSVDDFVEHAKDSATRCCGDDTTDCRCPKKASTKFQNHIAEWCIGVASCGAAGDGDGDEEEDSQQNTSIHSVVASAGDDREEVEIE